MEKAKRVLIVDDNVDGAESIAIYMRVLGHLPTVVSSGIEALKELPNVKPDVIFLDIGLPEMDGYEVARRLRTTDAGNAAYLVAMTGWGGAEDKRKAEEAGFNAHVTKPVDLSVVGRFVEEARTDHS